MVEDSAVGERAAWALAVARLAAGDTTGARGWAGRVPANSPLRVLIEAGQDIIARNYYRPRDPAVAARYAAQFPKVNLVTINDFGGWAAAQQKHFADGGVFDQIYAP